MTEYVLQGGIFGLHVYTIELLLSECLLPCIIKFDLEQISIISTFVGFVGHYTIMYTLYIILGKVYNSVPYKYKNLKHSVLSASIKGFYFQFYSVVGYSITATFVF